MPPAAHNYMSKNTLLLASLLAMFLLGASINRQLQSLLLPIIFLSSSPFRGMGPAASASGGSVVSGTQSASTLSGSVATRSTANSSESGQGGGVKDSPKKGNKNSLVKIFSLGLGKYDSAQKRNESAGGQQSVDEDRMQRITSQVRLPFDYFLTSHAPLSLVYCIAPTRHS